MDEKLKDENMLLRELVADMLEWGIFRTDREDDFIERAIELGVVEVDDDE